MSESLNSGLAIRIYDFVHETFELYVDGVVFSPVLRKSCGTLVEFAHEQELLEDAELLALLDASTGEVHHEGEEEVVIILCHSLYDLECLTSKRKSFI